MFCVDAALIGVLVAFLEIDDLPDWWRILICAVATSLVSNFAIQLLVPSLGVGAVPTGLALGSGVAAVGLRLVCRMSARRILIAVLVYFVVQTAFLTYVYRWAHPEHSTLDAHSAGGSTSFRPQPPAVPTRATVRSAEVQSPD